jgi:hypothetical protein
LGGKVNVPAPLSAIPNDIETSRIWRRTGNGGEEMIPIGVEIAADLISQSVEEGIASWEKSEWTG